MEKMTTEKWLELLHGGITSPKILHFDQQVVAHLAEAHQVLQNTDLPVPILEVLLGIKIETDIAILTGDDAFLTYATMLCAAIEIAQASGISDLVIQQTIFPEPGFNTLQ